MKYVLLLMLCLSGCSCETVSDCVAECTEGCRVQMNAGVEVCIVQCRHYCQEMSR